MLENFEIEETIFMHALDDSNDLENGVHKEEFV